MEQEFSRKRFVRLAGALGVGAAGASVAACGGGSGESGGGGGNGGGAASGTGAIARESEVAPGTAVDFDNSGDPAVLVRLEDGGFVAYSAVCTHQGCTVAYQDGDLACPCHGSVFDPAEGARVVNGPAQRPLPEIPVEVRGGEVVKA